MNRTMRWGAFAVGIAALQAIAVGVYVAVQQSRETARSFTYDGLDGSAAPDLEIVDARGRTTRLASLHRGTTLVHVWATWCAPCRTELPSLLALDGTMVGSTRLRVIAVSTDERWAPIDAFFGGRVPRSVWRGGPVVSRTYGVRALPETYVTNSRGVLLARMRGPRDWGSAEARVALAEIARGGAVARCGGRDHFPLADVATARTGEP